MFGTVLQTPGLTWIGTRSKATRELATRVDAKWMNALKQTRPRAWWLPFLDFTTATEGEELIKYVIDFEDLSTWQPRNGQRVARAPRDLLYARLATHPLYKDRIIPTRDLTRGAFGQWPDRISGMMMSAERMIGVFLRDALFSNGSAGTSSKLYTYQGGETGTQPLFARSGHYCDPSDPVNSQTFGNLHTGSDQAASGNALFTKGATAFDSDGWEYIQQLYMSRPGPGLVPLDMRVNFVLGGSFMKPYFKRQFKRVLVLDETGAAAVTNINATEMVDMAMGEEVTIPVVTGWLDAHPYRVANPTKQQFWTMSTTYAARPFGFALGEGGSPRIKVLDIGTEYEQLHDAIYIKGDMDMGICAGFPHVADEWRET